MSDAAGTEKTPSPSAPARPPGPSGATPPPATYRMFPRHGWGVPTVYVLLLLALLWEFPHLGLPVASSYLLAGILAIYLARELSVVYTIDADHLNAWRLFGWRRIPLDSISRVERTSLRLLAPVGMFGTWGWRSRLWSPQEGKLDIIHTFHDGVLVHGEGVPLFISPKDPDGFAHALVSRVEDVAPGVAAGAAPSAPG